MSDQKTILIIDDEQDTLTYFSSLLEDQGYKTVLAKDGEEGIKKVEEGIPDLITLDVTMPEMSGLKFYRTMKENDSFKSIPIIIITGVSKDFEGFISTRKQVPPPEGYISKPIEQDKLLEMIQDLI